MTEYYVTEERAMAPGISGEWPEVIPKPGNPNGRLVKCKNMEFFPKKDEVRVAAEALIAAGKKGSVSVNGAGCDFPAHVSVTFKNSYDAVAYHAALLSLILVLADE